MVCLLLGFEVLVLSLPVLWSNGCAKEGNLRKAKFIELISLKKKGILAQGAGKGEGDEPAGTKKAVVFHRPVW